MQTYVLIQAEPRAIEARLREEISVLPGVHRVVKVEGPFDLVVEVEGHEEPTPEAIPLIAGIDGVLHAIPLHVLGDDGNTAAGRPSGASQGTIRQRAAG